MSKLAPKDKFFDLSDYGRPPAKLIANSLQNTSFTAIHVTYAFGIAGLIAVGCILTQHFVLAALFIIIKSVIDGADGELARLKQKPSYIGRYLDSVFDILLNALLLSAISYVTHISFVYAVLAFMCMQLQGTLYNFYYVILRHASIGGDITSKIFETKAPTALHGESQHKVNILFNIYTVVYGGFDKTIQALDNSAHNSTVFPSWYMTLVSLYGLGFQLLIMAVMLAFNGVQYIIPFLITYTVFIPIIIGIRKVYFK
jgi:phosphatidylglycerophosphate synthase